MMLSAKEMKGYSFSFVCREIREVKRILNFFEFRNGIPRNPKEESWSREIKELEDIEDLEWCLSILRITAKNLREEMVYSELHTS